MLKGWSDGFFANIIGLMIQKYAFKSKLIRKRMICVSFLSLWIQWIIYHEIKCTLKVILFNYVIKHQLIPVNTLYLYNYIYYHFERI